MANSKSVLGRIWTTVFPTDANPATGTSSTGITAAGTVPLRDIGASRVQIVDARLSEGGLPGGQPLAPLSFETLTELHNALLRLGLSRATLLAAINPAFASSLPTVSSDAEQLWQDLNNLNRSSKLSDGSCPMRQFLVTAAQVAAARTEAGIFQAAVAKFDAADTSPPVPAYPDDETRTLARQLDNAYQRRAELRSVEADTKPVDDEILSLRRLIREGGQLRAGSSLSDGRFLLLKPIGHGGFGTVWEAQDRAAGYRVAIKVLHPNQAGDQVHLERFFRGARIMQSLADECPAVVRILLPEAEDGAFYYFVMELMSGDLQVLAERLSPEKAVRLLLPVCHTLSVAHQRGFVHRDVKPSNILLGAAPVERRISASFDPSEAGRRSRIGGHAAGVA